MLFCTHGNSTLLTANTPSHEVGGGGLAMSKSTMLHSLLAISLPPGSALPFRTTCGSTALQCRTQLCSNRHVGTRRISCLSRPCQPDDGTAHGRLQRALTEKVPMRHPQNQAQLPCCPLAGLDTCAAVCWHASCMACRCCDRTPCTADQLYLHHTCQPLC